jgi:predicted RNA methylase
MEKEMNITEQKDIIDKGLDTAIQFGLEVEVIFYALKAMKENPKLTPAEAFVFGVAEWVK